MEISYTGLFLHVCKSRKRPNLKDGWGTQFDNFYRPNGRHVSWVIVLVKFRLLKVGSLFRLIDFYFFQVVGWIIRENCTAIFTFFSGREFWMLFHFNSVVMILQRLYDASKIKLVLCLNTYKYCFEMVGRFLFWLTVSTRFVDSFLIPECSCWIYKNTFIWDCFSRELRCSHVLRA